MSIAQLPHKVDPATWADRGMQLTLNVSASLFPRLRQALLAEADVELNLGFTRDPRRHAVLTLRMQGQWPVQCQRCMQSMPLSVDESVYLHLLHEDEEAAHLDESEDYVLLDEQGELAVREVIEDELLLCLPLVARHEQCADVRLETAETAPVGEEKRKPFAGLAEMQKAMGGKLNKED